MKTTTDPQALSAHLLTLINFDGLEYDHLTGDNVQDAGHCFANEKAIHYPDQFKRDPRALIESYMRDLPSWLGGPIYVNETSDLMYAMGYEGSATALDDLYWHLLAHTLHVAWYG